MTGAPGTAIGGTGRPSSLGYRHTKIVATLGPASDSEPVIDGMLAAGLDVVRLALAHGDLREHDRRLRTVRRRAEVRGQYVAVMADLPGPKLRAAPFVEPVLLAVGATILLDPLARSSSSAAIGLEDPEQHFDLQRGDRVSIGDGAVVLQVDESGTPARATVTHGGTLLGSPGLRFPAERVQLVTPTESDLALLDWCIEADVDFVAASFVRSAADIEQIRRRIPRPGPLVVAKIETPDAVDRLDEIIEASDVIMVARGDLGGHLPIEDLPHLQKHIIRACVTRGRPVITATQMLESMVVSPMPTRAEATDVANAVLDGTDAVMLSGETAIGHDPVLVVETMARLVRRAEAEADYLQWGGRLAKVQVADGIPEAISHAAWRAAIDAKVAAILCCTRTGATPRTMARFRPLSPLVAVGPEARALRQLLVTWGVIPLAADACDSTDAMVAEALDRASGAGLVKSGDVVAVLAGTTTDAAGVTDVLRLVQVLGSEVGSRAEEAPREPGSLGR